jgi:hypothetical protein
MASSLVWASFAKGVVREAETREPQRFENWSGGTEPWADEQHQSANFD